MSGNKTPDMREWCTKILFFRIIGLRIKYFSPAKIK